MGQTDEGGTAPGGDPWAAVFESMPVGVVLQDAGGRITLANPAAQRILGLTLDQMQDRTSADPRWQAVRDDGSELPGDDHPSMVALRTAAPVRDVRMGVFNPVLGERRWLRVDATPLFQEGDGQPAQVYTTFQDVTDLRRSERSLRESEERYRLLVRKANDAVYVHEIHDGGVGRFIEANDRACEMLGYSREELLAMDVDAIDTPEQRRRVPAIVEELARSGQAVFETEHLAKDGRRIPVEIGASVFELQGRAVILSIVRDIGERRAAEAEITRLNEELQRRVVSKSEQLDAATRELESLAYSLAHDVRAPLRAIDGFSAAVLEDEAARLSAEGAGALRRVRAAAQTLARLLDELMNLSHVSRRELSRRVVDLSAIAVEVGEETAAEHASRTVDLIVAPGLTADADPALLRLILRELLDNAWKFTAPHAAARVEVGALDVDGERAFYVRDDGVGFDMRYAEHLFGVFQRMHPPGQFEGDGVGLATVQRLVRRHGGRVWAEAAPGRGAAVYFTLPDDGAAV